MLSRWLRNFKSRLWSDKLSANYGKMITLNDKNNNKKTSQQTCVPGLNHKMSKTDGKTLGPSAEIRALTRNFNLKVGAGLKATRKYLKYYWKIITQKGLVEFCTI